MSRFEQFISAILSIQILGVFKILIAAGLFIYVLFSLVIIRQVELMTGVLRGTLTPGLKLVGVLHFGFSLLVFLAALLIL